MEISGVSLLTNSLYELKLGFGLFWVVAVDENTCDEIFNMITLTNSFDYECEICGVILKDNDLVRAWVSSQGIKINIIICENSETQEKLGIEGVPWFIGIDSGNIFYSANVIPSNIDFKKFKDSKIIKEESYETKELIKQNSDNVIENGSENGIENGIENRLGNGLENGLINGQKLNFDKVLKESTELPNSSLLINKQVDSELEKALRKIEKLKKKLLEKDQIIEDCKLEIRQLKLNQIDKKNESKSPEKFMKIEKNESYEKNSEKKPERYEKLSKRENFKIEKFSNNLQTRFQSRLEEKDFWKIDNDTEDLEESVKFEEIAASKDLWLMGLFKSQIDTPNIKLKKVLPPLQVDKSKVNSKKRDTSNRKKEILNPNTNFSGVSSRKVLKSNKEI